MNSPPPMSARPQMQPVRHQSGGYVGGSVDSQSTLFPRPNYERWSSHINEIDTSFTSVEYHAYKDHSKRQLLVLLGGSTARFLITAGLCAAYILSVKLWQKRAVVDENHKRLFNAVTTGISLGLGLNIASSFKDLALNMRWPILHTRRRNLRELDLILNADSLSKLFKLVFITRRPWVIISCVLWLLSNQLAQTGIAVLNLTYGFDVNYSVVLFSDAKGNVSIPDMSHFYPNGDNADPQMADEEYTANLYGGLAFYGLDDIINQPKPKDIYKSANAMLWSNDMEHSFEMMFTDSPAKTTTDHRASSSYSDRRIKVTYFCEAHEVTGTVTDNSTSITVSNYGEVAVNNLISNDATNYFSRKGNYCEYNRRCSVVEAFENSGSGQWYYTCNITMSTTQNDPRNLSYVSDFMAHIATSSISLDGYADAPDNVVYNQVYPKNAPWGTAAHGDGDIMGFIIGMYALGSLAGTSLFNPRLYYQGAAPVVGSALTLGHPKYFYLIIALICGCHLLFIVIVAFWTNHVCLGPDTYLKMALLLRPIADALDEVSGGVGSGRRYEQAKKDTTVKYEKDGVNGRWHLKMLAS
ncbi:hypothetical protein BJ878DRAFT_414632 [Calycina marina]|uniref:Uncharacterized protein n=1 Tax=Calycina marina TaxID=1763456 RepID=A0A9P7Z971_9HELO|nr:hypothetical protein BJ878DRAFT_414632 [Calycina marina]